MKKLAESVCLLALLLGGFKCIEAQSILSIALKLETGIKTQRPQCEVTDVRVFSRKSEQGSIMLRLGCEGQSASITVTEHQSLDEAKDFVRDSLARVDGTLYHTIELSNLGDEGYAFANWDGSKPQSAMCGFRLGKVWFGITATSDDMAREVASSVSTLMQAT